MSNGLRIEETVSASLLEIGFMEGHGIEGDGRMRARS
jgi:hypothetical protein